MAGAFATERIAPGFVERDASRVLDRELAVEMGELGLIAPELAEQYGGRLLVHGHGGYDRGVMEQRLRDVLGFQIGDGTAQIMKTVIARDRVGRAAVPA